MTKFDVFVDRTTSIAPIEVPEPPSRPSIRREPLPSFEHFRLAVDERLDSLLQDECDRWCKVDENLHRGFDVLRSFIANGGKRMRPAFAFWGFVGCGGDPLDPQLVDLGAALEMLHTFALVHDDVMDGSALRRHAPTVHCALQADHERHGWLGEGRRFGEGMAVLLGDLAFVYSDFLTSALPLAVRKCFHDMKVELHVGQYLDLWSAAQADQTVERATSVILYKTAKYSVERPLHLGAAMVGESVASADTIRARCLSTYGLAVGEAFQLRDDLLGAYGEARTTGKATGDDFRDGKQTLLLVLARRWASACGDREMSPAQLAVLDRLGAADLSDEEVVRLQQILDASGARSHVEGRITELTELALDALPGAGLRPHAEMALLELAQQAAWRVA